jgi:hypothetical protein
MPRGLIRRFKMADQRPETVLAEFSAALERHGQACLPEEIVLTWGPRASPDLGQRPVELTGWCEWAANAPQGSA